MRKTGRNREADQTAERVRNGRDLAGQAAPRASDPLDSGPPFAPDALWRDWTTAPPKNTVTKSDSSDWAWKTRPAAEALQHAAPLAEAPPRGTAGCPLRRRRGRRLAGQHGLDPRPHGVGRHRPACIHLSTRSSCLRRPFGARCGAGGISPPESQLDCQRAQVM